MASFHLKAEKTSDAMTVEAFLWVLELGSLWGDDWHDLLAITMVTCHIHTHKGQEAERKRDLRSKLQSRFMECCFTV